MKEKEDLRIRKTKATLYKSLIQLLKTDNFEKISITDICKQAKINRSTFYEHYQDKETLLNDVMKETLQELEKYLVLTKETASIKENYVKIMELVCAYLEENQNLLELFPNIDIYFLLIEEIVQKKYLEVLDRNCQKEQTLSNKQIASFYIAGGIQLIKDSIKEENLFHKKEILTQLKKYLPEI